MYLENIVFDAVDPKRLGLFWEHALGTTTLTDEPDGFETRLTVPGGPELDLCFQRVPEPPSEPQRLHLDLRGGSEQSAVVDRMLALGAQPADIGQGDVSWVVLADVEENPFCVLAGRPVYAQAGPIAALCLDVHGTAQARVFWAALTGWVPNHDSDLPALQHPSGRGPLLELCPESAPKGQAKNRMHLDIRLEAGDDADDVARIIADLGGAELHPDWGDLPWRVFGDPSGNELCVLPAR